MLYSGKSDCIREDGRIRTKWLFSIKSGCFPSKFFYGKSGSNLAKVVVSGKSDCIRAKWLYMGKRGCIRAKVVVFGQQQL